MLPAALAMIVILGFEFTIFNAAAVFESPEQNSAAVELLFMSSILNQTDSNM
jgi:hypothetical protein